MFLVEIAGQTAKRMWRDTVCEYYYAKARSSLRQTHMFGRGGKGGNSGAVHSQQIIKVPPYTELCNAMIISWLSGNSRPRLSVKRYFFYGFSRGFQFLEPNFHGLGPNFYRERYL